MAFRIGCDQTEVSYGVYMAFDLQLFYASTKKPQTHDLVAVLVEERGV